MSEVQRNQVYWENEFDIKYVSRLPRRYRKDCVHVLRQRFGGGSNGWKKICKLCGEIIRN